MYVLTNNEVVEKYPYSIGELRRDNPQVSFPRNPTETLLAEYGVHPVQQTEIPEINSRVEKVLEEQPSLINDSWTQTWSVIPLTQAEREALDFEKAEEVRSIRNQKLVDTDWTQVADAPVNQQVWAEYRQQLRDITKQPGFPWEVQWPQQPE